MKFNTKGTHASQFTFSRREADLQCIAKGSLVLQANGCDDGKLQILRREHVCGVSCTSKTCLYDDDINLQWEEHELALVICPCTC